MVSIQLMKRNASKKCENFVCDEHYLNTFVENCMQLMTLSLLCYCVLIIHIEQNRDAVIHIKPFG